MHPLTEALKGMRPEDKAELIGDLIASMPLSRGTARLILSRLNEADSYNAVHALRSEMNARRWAERHTRSAQPV